MSIKMRTRIVNSIIIFVLHVLAALLFYGLALLTPFFVDVNAIALRNRVIGGDIVFCLFGLIRGVWLFISLGHVPGELLAPPRRDGQSAANGGKGGLSKRP